MATASGRLRYETVGGFSANDPKRCRVTALHMGRFGVRTPEAALDLWIAATELTDQLPIATGNAAEFSRVPDLEVIEVG